MADAQTPVLTDEQIEAIADEHCRAVLRAARAAGLMVLETADVRILASQPDRAVMQQALDAIDAEFSDEWECNSYHPKLHAARAALFAALSATMEKPHGN